MCFGSGNSYEYFKSPSTKVDVRCAPTVVDLANTFVLDPGFVTGNIRLHGPSYGPLASPLNYIQRSTAGTPTPPADVGLNNSSYVSASFAGTTAPGSGEARALFQGSFPGVPATDFVGSYALGLSGLNLAPTSKWLANQLLLYLNNTTPVSGAPYLSSQLIITDNNFPVQITSCKEISHHLDYCFSEVDLNMSAGNGILSYAPQVSGSGTYGASYRVNLLYANGTPSTPASSGQVVLFLPQGTYNLSPTLYTVDSSSGKVSLTKFNQINNLVVGCGQIMCATPDIHISLDNPPSCSLGDGIIISGNISSVNPVNTISYVSDAGGAPADVSPPGGAWKTSPPFSFRLPLLPCTHSYTITATDRAGNTACVTFVITAPPAIACPADMTVDCGVPWSFGTPTVSGECIGGDVTIAVLSTVTNGVNPEVITRIWKATDLLCGNFTTCTNTVTVVFPPPLITNCQTNLTVAACSTNIPDFTLQLVVSDNCFPQSDLVITQKPLPGGTVAPGTYPIIVKVCDPLGNCARCSSTFTVLAMTPEPRSVWNTGVDAHGVPLPLPPLGTPDPHYTLVKRPSSDPFGLPLPPVRPVAVANFSGWSVPADSDSSWIGTSTFWYDYAPGDYTYETYITNNCGEKPMILEGRWAAADSVQLWFGTALAASSSGTAYGAWEPFRSAYAFAPGPNAADFVVHLESPGTNFNTTGLRVEWTNYCGCEIITIASNCVAPASCMVSWWPGEGNANDIIGTNSGTLEGGVTFAPGEVGQAFGFNGSNSWVQVPNSPSLNVTGPFTLECWVNPSTIVAGTGYDTTIVYMGPPAGTAASTPYGLSLGISNRIDAFVGDGTNANFFSSITLLPVGSWSHVAFMGDGTNLSIYINGALDASMPQTIAPFRSPYPFLIGGGVNPMQFNTLSGLIDELSLYKCALRPDQIAAIYAAGSFGKCEPALTGGFTEQRQVRDLRIEKSVRPDH